MRSAKYFFLDLILVPNNLLTTGPEGLRKETKNQRQDIRSSDRDFNPGLPKYEAELFNTEP